MEKRQRTAGKRESRGGIGDRIHFCMNRGKWTNQSLGEAIGMDRANISHYRTGKHEPDWETIQRMAEVFGVSDYWLLSGRRYPRRMIPDLMEFMVRWTEAIQAGASAGEAITDLVGAEDAITEEERLLMERLGPSIAATTRSGDAAVWTSLSGEDWHLVESLARRLGLQSRGTNRSSFAPGRESSSG